jgi:hypothetical protein
LVYLEDWLLRKKGTGFGSYISLCKLIKWLQQYKQKERNQSTKRKAEQICIANYGWRERIAKMPVFSVLLRLAFVPGTSFHEVPCGLQTHHIFPWSILSERLLFQLWQIHKNIEIFKGLKHCQTLVLDWGKFPRGVFILWGLLAVYQL